MLCNLKYSRVYVHYKCTHNNSYVSILAGQGKLRIPQKNIN